MIYSPSSREEFSFCPRKWWLRKTGIVSRIITYPELCAIGGVSIGKAMEVWNKALIAGQEITIEELLLEGSKQLHQEIQTREQQGRRIGSSKDQGFLDALPLYIEQGIRLLYRINPLKQYAIVAAEEEFPHAGNCRLDVRVKQPDGRGIVFDYKVKFGEVEEKWLDKEFEKHFNGEQKYTYTALTNTDMFGIILVLLRPRKDKRALDPKIVVRTVNITDTEKRVWLRDAQLMTEPMNRTLLTPSPTLVMGKTYPHSNEYGPCVYDDLCNRYQLDPELWGMDFVTIERNK